MSPEQVLLQVATQLPLPSQVSPDLHLLEVYVLQAAVYWHVLVFSIQLVVVVTQVDLLYDVVVLPGI